MATSIWAHSSVCVSMYVFLLILTDVMKTISSLALGQSFDRNRREYSSEKSSFPCSSCVTLAVGNGGCASTTKGVVLSPLWSVCCRLSRLFCHLMAREKFIMFTVLNTPAAHTGPLMMDRRDKFSPCAEALTGYVLVLKWLGWQLY